MESQTIHTRISKDLKLEADAVFHAIGLSSADAIRLFYQQVTMRRGLPFEVRISSLDSKYKSQRTKALSNSTGVLSIKSMGHSKLTKAILALNSTSPKSNISLTTKEIKEIIAKRRDDAGRSGY